MNDIIMTYESFKENELNERKIPKSLFNKVELTNKWIKEISKEDLFAIEPDSTWESSYDFKEIKHPNNFMTIEYTEFGGAKDKHKERFSLKNEQGLEDAMWHLSWIIRSIKKGFREAGQKVPTIK